MTERLGRLYNRFFVESGSALSTFLTADLSPCQAKSVHLYCQEMCAIRLYDAWSRFCRELVVISACARPVTVGGTVVARAPGVMRRSDVELLLKQSFGRTWRQGPRWGDPGACIDAATRLAIGNLSTVAAAIGSTPSPVDDLRRIRNFVAHREKKWALSLRSIARRYGAGGATDAAAVLRNLIPPGVCVFEAWIHQLRAMAASAVT